MRTLPTKGYDYVAYIDEAGDPGLQRIRPLDPGGSSEWLVVSAVVMKAEHEPEAQAWVRSILQQIGSRQRTDIHFADLYPHQKAIVTSALTKLPICCFAMCSNKKNMKKYRNVAPEIRMGVKDWFYSWMTRMVLERVTHFAWSHSVKTLDSVRPMKVIYSTRGGLNVSQMAAYYEWIKRQSLNDNLWLPWGDIEWEMLTFHLLGVMPHHISAGLQLADIVASAFYKAADKHHTGACDATFARILDPRMARFPFLRSGHVSGYGVKLLPNFERAKLDADQSEIFRHYGYPRQLWQNKRDWRFVPPPELQRRRVPDPSNPKVC